MTPTQETAQREYQAYITTWLESFATDAGIPLAVLRAGGRASRRVSPIRDECAYRLHAELGLSATQVASALNAAHRCRAAEWIVRGRERCAKPAGLPDPRQPTLPLVA